MEIHSRATRSNDRRIVMKAYRTLAAVTLLGVVAATAATESRQAQERRSGDGRSQGQTRMRFRSMDTDGDGVITRAEWRGNDQSFRRQDTNGDGVLSGAEVRAPIEATGDDKDGDGVITRSEWRGTAQLFRDYDTNRDGVLSGAEVRAVVEDSRPWTDEDARRVSGLAAERFRREDLNADDRIERDEWTGTAAAFTRMDRNADGVLTRAEFAAAAGDRAAATTGQRRQTPTYQAGYDKGLVEGRAAGKEDRTINGGKWDLEGQRELETADSGYEPRLGPREEYQAGYRAGFRLGYREGFGPR
jgi:Ca2+-binding EF-hand superfamily protein